MIGAAVASIIIFHGLSDFLLNALKEVVAENQFGNMQIASEKYWSPGKESRREKMFDLGELRELSTLHPEILSMSGRISFSGLISNGDSSTGGKVIGMDIIGEPQFKKSLKITKGRFFSGAGSREGLVGQLLAKQMNVGPGDTLTVLTNTVDGVMNAQDIKVTGLFSAGLDEIDSKVMFVPLEAAQSILDTPKVDIAIIKFHQLIQAEQHSARINEQLKKSKLELKARTWRELSTLYRQCEKFYSVQNKIIEMILLTLMFLGILNAVSMTVVERTGEIGTLRSMGERRSDIVGQFILESILLTILGIVTGAISAWIFIQLIHAVKLYTEMPGATIPVMIDVNFLFSSVVYASSLSFIIALIATYLPAKKIVSLNIVEALRKNI
jgi:putative ABC transport system permease protein